MALSRMAHEAAGTSHPALHDLQEEKLYGALNAVKKESMIRVEADEVTYPLHIILR